MSNRTLVPDKTYKDKEDKPLTKVFKEIIQDKPQLTDQEVTDLLKEYIKRKSNG